MPARGIPETGDRQDGQVPFARDLRRSSLRGGVDSKKRNENRASATKVHIWQIVNGQMLINKTDEWTDPGTPADQVHGVKPGATDAHKGVHVGVVLGGVHGGAFGAFHGEPGGGSIESDKVGGEQHDRAMPGNQVWDLRMAIDGDHGANGLRGAKPEDTAIDKALCECAQVVVP